jgi:hypothetical protein
MNSGMNENNGSILIYVSYGCGDYDVNYGYDALTMSMNHRHLSATKACSLGPF